MPGSSPGMTPSVLQRYFFFRRTVFFADFRFAGRRMAADRRFAAFRALALRFTFRRFFAGPTSRLAPRTAFNAAPVAAFATVLAAPAAVSAALPAIDRAPSMPVRATSVTAFWVVVMMPGFVAIGGGPSG